jgi:phosphoglucosamine mutase
MISASHNPAADNGIKLFGKFAAKLDDATEDRIEARARADAAPEPEIRAPPVDQALETEYLNALLATAKGLALDGLAIVLDCANGGASRVAPRVLARLGAKVTAVADAPDGDNINDGCGATSLALAESEVRRRGAHLGIALDGDGDRCMLVDERGRTVNGDAILALVARHMAARGELVPRKVVATVMSNKGLQRALREIHVELVTVDVGDRRVVEALRQSGAKLGGEQSGHIVFGADHHYIGDGIYTALRVLAVLRAAGRPLSELARVYQPYPQVLLSVPVRRKPPLAEQPGVRDALRAAEGELGDDGRVLLRYSGTEPLARVMVEGPDAARSEELARRIASAVATAIGAEARA